MTKLIAAHQAKMGDVVYLHPEHDSYTEEGIGIVITAAMTSGNPHDVVPLFIATDKLIKRIDDSERCIEVVSKKVLADVTGYTLRQVTEWVAEAKQGKLDKAFMTLMQAPAEPWQPEKPPYQADEDTADVEAMLAAKDAEDEPAF